MDFNLFQNNPAFSGLTPEKLEFLKAFAGTKKPTQMQEMAPFLISTLNNAKKQNIQFSQMETELLIQVLKQNLSPEEAARADKMISLMKERRSGK